MNLDLRLPMDCELELSAEYPFDTSWARTLSNEMLIHMWMTLGRDVVKDSRARIVLHEMGMRGIASPDY